VARRGAAAVPPTGASDAWRAATRAKPDEAPPREPWRPEEWIDEGELRDQALGAIERSREGRPATEPARQSAQSPTDATKSSTKPPAGSAGARGRASRTADRAGPAGGSQRGSAAGGPAEAPDADDGADDVRRTVPTNRLPRFQARLKEASESFRRGRFEEARHTLRPLAQQAPGASSVRELYGLTLYRLGRWAQAARELEAFRTQTGSTEQHPVLADCYRALGRYAEVEELWDELRAASPRGDLVAEGRIVAAGALADQGRLDDAIRLLEGGNRPARAPQLHHLRMAYALADLYERAGDLPRARELFGRVAASDPAFVDVEARLRALR
jgi:thioredoxin-like negative regulator of GroEL